ncbi:MAG: helix-turn-helix transcriptional regulator, partial [Alphaproteobacteria bacterium]|nr:helix-turn-helix transcriptional regulator [Alphaproteobacteria bacterium]
MSGHRQIHGGNEHTERINKLTPREKQALELASAPLGSKEIAEQLGISKLTVDRYIADAVTKLG